MRDQRSLLTALSGLLVLTLSISPVAAVVLEAAAVHAPPMSVPMSAGSLAVLQNYLATSAGVSLLRSAPALREVASMSPSAPAQLQALGPLAASLPPDFASRARATIQGDWVGETLAKAYAAAAPAALREIDARAHDAAWAAASTATDDPAKIRALVTTASDLQFYSLYGPAARARAWDFAALAAAVRTRANAEDLARRLQAGARRPESGDAAVAGEGSGAARPAARLRRRPRVQVVMEKEGWFSDGYYAHFIAVTPLPGAKADRKELLVVNVEPHNFSPRVVSAYFGHARHPFRTMFRHRLGRNPASFVA